MDLKVNNVSCVCDCSQINLRKSRVASAEANTRVSDIMFITEPYINPKTKKAGGLDQSMGMILTSSSDSPRAALRIRKDLHPWLIDGLSDGDICTAEIWISNQRVVVCSAYLDITYSPVNVLLSKVSSYCASNHLALVVGMDSNSHSLMWGCEEENSRGTTLEDWLVTNNLTVLNQGREKTFITSRASSIIDITLCNDTAINSLDISAWRVNTEKESFSDHRYINFTMGEWRPLVETYRNLNQVNWQLYKEKLSTFQQPQIKKDCSNLDECANWIVNRIQETLEAICPKRRALNRPPNPWWNEDLTALREEVRILNNARLSSGEANESYIKKRMEYSRAIRKAKKESWQDFCTSQESMKALSGLMQKLDKKKKSGLSLLRTSEQCSPSESLEALMDTHFPDSVKWEGDMDIPAPNINVEAEVIKLVEDIVTVEKVTKAFESFGPKKAPGPDEFNPVILSNLPGNVILFVTNMYKKVLLSGKTPHAWRSMKVISQAIEAPACLHNRQINRNCPVRRGGPHRGQHTKRGTHSSCQPGLLRSI